LLKAEIGKIKKKAGLTL